MSVDAHKNAPSEPEPNSRGIGSDERTREDVYHVLAKRYPPETIERWKEGARRFGAFCETLDPAEWTSIAPYEFGSFTKRPPPTWLQAIFLGEKPASMATWNDSARAKLEASGIGTTDSQKAYDPQAVLEKARQYPDLFEGLPLDDPAAIMSAIDDSTRKNSQDVRGTLYGYPADAVANFMKPNFLKEGATFDANGVIWTDLPHSTQSIQWKQRLEDAFQISGILSIKPSWCVPPWYS